ncbi:MAG: type II toxin-antitoxin system Phd/YefM family antitoxin [Coriobacteriia bacterium]|nr:type II toxin-antitoxin system Phd/YefM family antitoxin [Coriobacteriia bacterium]MBS5477496.1 type II toxin-antitoxin system Phd/YefM family antitoxin [Coriobacteriia bacterium]
MPAIKPLSEFSRNQTAVIDELSETGEPMYLTRNGSACVVVMDAGAFDEAMRFRDELREREMRIKEGIERGMREIASGECVDAEEADRKIRAARGWL